MTGTWAGVLISAGGLVLSIVASAWISGAAWAKIRGDVNQLQQERPKLASKDQVDVLARDVAEIKGMFRVTLSPEYGGRE